MKDARINRWRDVALRGEFLWASGIAPPLPMHHHPTLQVGMVLDGVLDVAIAGGFDGSFPAPNLVVVPAGVPHRVTGRPDTFVEYAQVELPPADSPLLRCREVRDGVAIATTDPRACEAFIELLMASHGAESPAVRTRSLQSLVDAVIAADLQELGGRIDDPFVVRVLSHLERVTDRTLPLSELLRSERVSRATLLRRFRRELGGSPHDYHLSVRRNRAFELIERGLSVAEASLEAGFHDQSHFTRHARTILAMGPGSWRRRRRVR